MSFLFLLTVSILLGLSKQAPVTTCTEGYCAKGAMVSNIFRIDGQWSRTLKNGVLLSISDEKGPRHLYGEIQIDSTVNGFFDGIYDDREGYFGCENCLRRPLMFAVPKPASGKYEKMCIPDTVRHNSSLDNEDLKLRAFTVDYNGMKCFIKNSNVITDSMVEKIRKFQVLPPKSKLLKKRDADSLKKLIDGMVFCQGTIKQIVEGKYKSCNEVPNFGLCGDYLGWACKGEADDGECDFYWGDCRYMGIGSQCSSELIKGLNVMQACSGLAIAKEVADLRVEALEKIRDVNKQVGVALDGVKVLTNDQDRVVKVLKDQDLALGTLNAQSNNNTVNIKKLAGIVENQTEALWDAGEKLAFSLDSLRQELGRAKTELGVEISKTRGQLVGSLIAAKEDIDNVNQTTHYKHDEHYETFRDLKNSSNHLRNRTNEAIEMNGKMENKLMGEIKDAKNVSNSANTKLKQSLDIKTKSLVDDPVSSVGGKIATGSAIGTSTIIVLIIIFVVCLCIRKRAK